MYIQSYIYIGVAIRCTVKGSLIVFTVERSGKGVSPASYSAFYRKLYGYNNSSHYGKYHSRVPGFLDRIGYIKYANGVILVLRENSSSVVEYLKKNSAKVFQWEVELSKMEETDLQEGKH
jgi:hypothetical protein